MYFYRQKLQRNLFWMGYLNFYYWGVGQVSIQQEQLFTDMPLRLKFDSLSAPKFKAFRDMGPKTGNLNTSVLAFTHMNSWEQQLPGPDVMWSLDVITEVLLTALPLQEQKASNTVRMLLCFLYLWKVSSNYVIHREAKNHIIRVLRE